MGSKQIDTLMERLARIETALVDLLRQRPSKEWYSTAEVANLLRRAEYTVREWCRNGRLKAKKKPCGRGKGGEWLISHQELTRLQNEGLLPFARPSAHVHGNDAQGLEAPDESPCLGAGRDSDSRGG